MAPIAVTPVLYLGSDRIAKSADNAAVATTVTEAVAVIKAGGLAVIPEGSWDLAAEIIVELGGTREWAEDRVAFAKFNENHVEGGHGSPPHGGTSGEFGPGDGGSGGTSGGSATGTSSSTGVSQAVQTMWSNSAFGFRMAAGEILHQSAAPGYHTVPGEHVFTPTTDEQAGALAMLTQVNSGAPAGHELWRGLSNTLNANTAGGRPFQRTSEILGSLQTGKTIDMPLAGFSTSRAIGESFGTLIVFHAPATTKGFTLQANAHSGEREFITGGRFKVASVTDAKGVSVNMSDPASPFRVGVRSPSESQIYERLPLHVELEQVATFDPSKVTKAASLSPSDYEPWVGDELCGNGESTAAKSPSVASPLSTPDPSQPVTKSRARVHLFSKFNSSHVEGGHGSPPHGGTSGEFAPSEGTGGLSATSPNPPPGFAHPVTHLISAHMNQPEPIGPSGRGTAMLDNPDATFASRLPQDVVAKMTAALAASPGHPTPGDLVTNLNRLYADTVANDPAAIRDGKTWYADAQTSILGSGSQYGFDARTAIGLTAAMSPQNEWGQNVAEAQFLMKTIHENPTVTFTAAEKNYLTSHNQSIKDGSTFSSLDPTAAAWTTMVLSKRAGIRSAIPTPTGKYGLVQWSTGSGNVASAIEIARGADPNGVINGLKVRSFFNNISDPYNTAHGNNITMDTHAVSAALAHRYAATDATLKKLVSTPKFRAYNTGSVYPLVADAFRTVAAQHGLQPNQMQAALWLHWQTVRFDPKYNSGKTVSARLQGRYKNTQPGSGRKKRG